MKYTFIKKFKVTFFSVLMLTVGTSIHAFEPTGDSFKAEFKITSWTASNTDSTITSEGIVGEGFGKVYLTHNFRSNS